MQVPGFIRMGKKGKNGGGDGGDDEPKVFSVISQMRKMVTLELKDQFVVLQTNLMNWEFMNEEIVFKTSAHVFQVKEALERLHGKVRDLRVAKTVFDPEHMLGDNYTELNDDELADKTKHMTPEELFAFKTEMQEQKKKAMDMDMLTLEDYDFEGFADGEEAVEDEGAAEYSGWLRKLDKIKKSHGQVRKNEDGRLEVVYQIFYDFKPVDHENPLMLSHSQKSSGAKAEEDAQIAAAAGGVGDE